MRFALPFVALVALLLAGCKSDLGCDAQYVPITGIAPAAAPCAAPAASPCAPALAPAPQFAYTTASPVAVQFRVGLKEHIRAGLAWTPQLAGCLWNGIYKVGGVIIETGNCVLQNLVPPDPVPTQTFLYAPPPQFAAPAPVAAPCR